MCSILVVIPLLYLLYPGWDISFITWVRIPGTVLKSINSSQSVWFVIWLMYITINSDTSCCYYDKEYLFLIFPFILSFLKVLISNWCWLVSNMFLTALEMMRESLSLLNCIWVPTITLTWHYIKNTTVYASGLAMWNLVVN